MGQPCLLERAAALEMRPRSALTDRLSIVAAGRTSGLLPLEAGCVGAIAQGYVRSIAPDGRIGSTEGVTSGLEEVAWH